MTVFQQHTVARLAKAVATGVLQASKAATDGRDADVYVHCDAVAAALRAARSLGVFDATVASLKARAAASIAAE